MPLNPKSVVENNFTKGLITYATGMNFPENAVVASNNMRFNPWGLAQRRPGLDFEDSFQITNFDSEGQVIAGFFWKDGTSTGDFYFYVLQVGNLIAFYKIDPTQPAVSTDQFFSFNLADHQILGGQPWTECQFASGNGYLFIVNQNITPLAIALDSVTGLPVITESPVMVRDFVGFAEGTVNGVRPGGITAAHNYNLLNQGWTDGVHGDDVTTNKIATFATGMGVYPSNADIWWEFKDSSNTFTVTSSIVNSVSFGNTPAPKGHFVLDAFQQDISAAYGSRDFDPYDITSGNTRPTAVAFFANRVFYAGVPSPGFSQNIYFSQIIDTLGSAPQQLSGNNGNYLRFGACLQLNDPTSEQNFALLPTDGGIIKIPEVGIVYRLWPLQGALIVFASNGIWSITGTQSGLGFTATDYSVNKISSIRCISHTSFVDVLGMPMWWTHEGIYSLTVNTTANVSSGGFEVKSLTDFTIPDLFHAIPGLSKLFARGTYDYFNYEVRWLYNSQQPAGVDDEYTYDSMLVLNVKSGAFYPWSFPTDNVKIREIFTSITTSPDVNSYLLKYVVSTGGPSFPGFTMAEELNTTNYIDWFRFDGIGENFISSFDTGFRIHADADKRWNNNYVTIYQANRYADQANPDEPRAIASSAFVKGKWDYSLNYLPNRWGAQQLCRILDNSFSNQIVRLRIRGRGRVFQLNFISDGSYPMNLEGWATSEIVNQRP